MDLSNNEPSIAAGGVSAARENRPVDTTKYHKAMAVLLPILNKLGFDSLRAGQDRAVINLLMGQDTLCFLPTGFGKSLIYIASTLCLDCRCLIFSPLVSLMKDQVESLWRMDLAAAQISGSQTPVENDMALRAWECGELKFLLAAPERMNSAEFIKVMSRQPPNMLVLDEAHCLSSWGDSFRPAYIKIGPFIDMCNPDLVLALTATATSAVESDIRKVLRIPNAHKVVYYPARTNLVLSSQVLRSIYDIEKSLKLVEGPVIIYAPTHKRCEELYRAFGHKIEGGSLVYHGGLDDGARTTHQELFMTNQIRVMFATNAFGMGVNKPDIRGVIHCGFSKSVDSYAQESGRGGRDGKESQCLLYTDEYSYNTQMYLIDMNYPGQALIERVMEHLLQRADRDGTVCLTGVQIAEEIKEARRAGQVASALQILARYGAVERSKEEEALSRVKIVKTHPEVEHQSCLDLLQSIGVKNADGYYEFGMPVFLAQSKWTEKKAKDRLSALDREGYIQYTRPFRGKTTKILKGIGVVDFPGLKARRMEEVKKLSALRDYAETEDENKHQFLLDYFGIL